MDKKYIQDLYNQLGGQDKFGSFEDFQVLITTDKTYQKDFYNSIGSETLGDFNDFTALVSTPVKKKDLSVSEQSQPAPAKAMGSSSADGSLGTPPTVRPQKKLTQEDLENISNTDIKDMSGKVVFSKAKQEEAKKTLTRISEEKKVLESEKKKYSDVFDRQLKIKPKPAESQYLNDRLASINTSLINKTEEYVVPEMEYQFGDLGFKFEETGAMGDYMKVTAPNGKTIEVSLDNFLSSKSSKQAETLKSFIKTNAPAKGLFVLENTLREQDKKFNSQKDVDNSIKSITKEVNDLNQRQKQFLAKTESLEKEVEEFGNTEEIEKKRLALMSEMKSLLSEEEKIKARGQRLNAAVAKYGISEAKKGGWSGGIWDSFNRGIGKMTSGITSLISDVQTEIMPAGYGMSPKDLKNVSIDIAKKIGVTPPSEKQSVEEWKKTLTEDQLDQWEDEVDDVIKKDIKGRVLPYVRIGAEEIFGDPETTKQWSDLKKESFWGGAILGLSESLPAMIGGSGPAGWAQRTAQMYAQVSDGVMEEMEKDPDFANISENEKLAVTLPIGITSAVLEAYGLRNVLASKGVINSITMSVLGRAGANTSARTFRELVENEVESKLAKGLLTVTAAGIAEFETGAAQELSESTFKSVYNKIKEKNMFNTPDSKMDLLENVLVAGAQEAVGGFILGVPTGVSTAYSEKGFLKMDDITFTTFENMANDDKMQSAYIANLKQQIAQGIITVAQGKEQLNNYRNSVGLFRQLPDGLTTEQKKEAMNLLKEKRDLETYVNGKDAALVVKQKNRITEINDSLTKLSETNAIQEQSTAAVPVQPETGVSETVEERVSGPKPEVVTEEGTKEEVIIPEQHRQEYDARINQYEGLIQDLEKDLEKEESKGVLSSWLSDAANEKKWIKEEIDRYKNKVKLLKENPVEFFKQELKDVKESHEERINEDPDYKQRIVDEYGTTEFDVVYSDAIDNFNRKISDYESAKEVVTPTIESTQPQTIIDTNVTEYLGNPTITEVEDGQLYEFRTEDGIMAGVMTSPTEFRIDGISANEVGKGKGSRMFEKLIAYLKDKGVTTINTRSAGEGAVRMHNKAVEKGLLTKVEEDGRNATFTIITEQVAEPQDVLLGQDIAEQLGLPPAPEGFDIVSEPAPVIEAPAVADLLELDTTDKTNLQRVADFLDRLDSALDIDPNELNDVTRVMTVTTAKAVIKALKALVNAGITLQEAINRVSAEQKVTPEQIIDAMNIVSKINENKAEGVSEFDLPGYNRMVGEIEGIIEKSKKRRVSADKIADNVMSYVMGSKVYEDATDVQREALVREVRKRFGLKEKSAPSVGKLFGKIKDIKKITMTEKDALIKQIKDTAKGAKDAISASRRIAEQLSKDVKELAATGSITAKQAANVIRAFSKVNVFSQKSVDKFVDYMTKVFENADYADNIRNANKLRKIIKKLSRNKDKNVDLRTVGSEFSKIDPSMVDNIFEYNKIASEIKNAIKGTAAKVKNFTVADTINIDEVSDYIAKTLKSQEVKLREESIKEIQDLLDVDASQFSAEDIDTLLSVYGEGKSPSVTKYNEGIIRAAVKKAFDTYSAMIKKSISDGVDLFTGEDTEYTREQKAIIQKFMKMDTNKMDIKDSVAAIDSLVNFLVNKSTAKMEAVIAEYEGEQNAREVESNKKIVKTDLRKLWSKPFAKFLGEQTTSLPILFEKKFKGFNAAGYVMEKMGISELINRKSFAQRQATNIVNDYVNEFYKKTANGQAFNTLFNSIERGMNAFMTRNIVGTQQEMQEEFNRRKGLIEQSIDALSEGNKTEQEKAKVYREVYDKILKDSKNYQEVQSKTDAVNNSAVKFWVDQWDSKFDKLSDVAKNVYNKELSRDLNYTPDKYTRIKYDRGDVDLENSESAFINNTDGVLYKKETGVLMSKKPSSTLPSNRRGNVTAYIDLSFDKNNSNSMYDALVDIETAASVRQVQSFIDSKSFEKIFGDDSQIFRNRLKSYVQNSRKKSPFSDDELSKAINALNRISSFGASQVLAGPLQPIKQVIPVMFNTLLNTGGYLDVKAPFDADFNAWLNKAGYAISNRGVESQAQIDSINKLIDEAASSKGEKLLKYIEKINKAYLDVFLAKPDVAIARASWKSYYEQSLREQGIDDKDINYKDHEVNKEAANYAQRMVDRQQNISDPDLAGKLFSSKEKSTQVLTKIFMPLASFRMNQSSRLAADLTTLGYWNSATKEDRKIAIRSLSGFLIEATVFKVIAAGIGLGISSMALSYMGEDDEEERKKRRDAIVKGNVTGAVTDVLSPIPVADKLVQWGSANSLEFAQDMMGLSEKDKVSLYSPKGQDFFQQLGMFGITGTRAKEVAELVDMYATGTYKDQYDNVREIPEEKREKLGALIGPSILTGFGLLPSEVASFTRNSVKVAKKKGISSEEKQKMQSKIEDLQEVVEGNYSEQTKEAASKLIEKMENPEDYKEEKSKLNEMKKELLYDEEKDVTYDNVTDLKKYNPKLWKKNFGPGSEWDDLTKDEKKVQKIIKDKETKAEEEEFNYDSGDGKIKRIPLIKRKRYKFGAD